ncbi:MULTISPECIES: hypothetical protein [Nocardia]|uniref:hypothetical protein n=1 Tax=Nocardia TaxID=1817 RepID=UPI0011DC8EC9|nr:MULTISPECIES: hypothetical protein [Nocardia]
MSGAVSGRAPGCIRFRRRNVCEHEPYEQIPVRDAVRAIQKWLQDYEDRIAAAVESGRRYYVGQKVHSADCSTLRHNLWPTNSWYWVTETDDLDVIEARYAEINDGEGSGGYEWGVAGNLVTREQASNTALPRCRTCVPDVNPRTSAKRPKKVSGLGASDLGRLLYGQPIVSITYEPGGVFIQTSEARHRFDLDGSVLLDPAPSSQPESHLGA